MVRIRTLNDIVLNTLDFYRQAQPQLDTKPGTVARDLLVNGPASQVSPVYEELARVESSQTLRNSIGQNLDRLASNFGATRRQGTTASGTAIFTLASLDADVVVNAGDLVRASSGTSFQVTSGQVISTRTANVYRATASQYRAELDFVGITDEFATEVPVEAVATGISGNLSKYSLVSTGTAGINNVTNVLPFGGGAGAENDTAFRSRVLAIFSGANTGTSLGYREAVLGDPLVTDAIVVGPGDPLMTRDGTQVVDVDGVSVIVSEGTGGKVDVYTFGFRLQEILDSYIYRDKSNQNDPTAAVNDFVLGQIPGDDVKPVVTRRRDDLRNGVLPDQPVNNILSVTGSISGSNFLPFSVSETGVSSGNYELIRDTGAYGGSPWGQDRLHWTSSSIDDFSQDVTKGSFNGQDSLTFPGATSIPSAEQSVEVVNENSRVDSLDRSSIQLAHKPITAVSRVLNLTTGERYTIVSQNPDGTGTLNETGRIVIGGNTLPATSDTLQVDYTWAFLFDPNFDYDNLTTSRNIRPAVDVVDWGYSNEVRREQSVVAAPLLSVSVQLPVSAVVSVNTFDSEGTNIQFISERLAVQVPTAVANVVSVSLDANGAQLWDTARSDGSISGFVIFLPTDAAVTDANVGDPVTVVFNANDVFTVGGDSGSFEGDVITLPASAPVSVGTVVECNYLADVRVLLPATLIPALPAFRSSLTPNQFTTETAPADGFQPYSFTFGPAPAPGAFPPVETNLRQAPSRLALTVEGTVSPGVIAVLGTTLEGVFDVLFFAVQDGLTQDLAAPMKVALGLRTVDPVPNATEIVRLISLQKVTTAFGGREVTGVAEDYDIQGYGLRNNEFVKNEAVPVPALSRSEVRLPSTFTNTNAPPVVGDALRATFYIGRTSVTETVSFSVSGTLYTQKIFGIIDSISVSSGFTSGASQTSTLAVANMNQPPSGGRYTGTYDYIAPKVNERITVRYNLNQAIHTATFAVEATRPVTADVLVKTSTPVLIDATLVIVVSVGFEDSAAVVAQNVNDAVTTTINATALGTTLDESDLIAVAQGVNGVDRTRVTHFNLADQVGRVLSITAEENEFLQSNLVIVTAEER